MEKLDKWMKKKVKKAKEVVDLLTGEKPGVDYFWETNAEGIVPVVLLLRLPLPGQWDSRKVVETSIEFLQLLGGACEVQGDKETAQIFFYFVTVLEVALEKDRETNAS